MTVNDAIDVLCNSNKWAGADIYICPPDSNCSDQDSAGEEDLQLHNLSRRQLLAQCGLQVATTDTDEMVVTDKVEKLEMMSSSGKMSLLPSNVNCWVKVKIVMRNKKTLKRWLRFLPHLEIQKFTALTGKIIIFDNELIDFIVQMTNTYAIETQMQLVGCQLAEVIFAAFSEC